MKLTAFLFALLLAAAPAAAQEDPDPTDEAISGEESGEDDELDDDEEPVAGPEEDDDEEPVARPEEEEVEEEDEEEEIDSSADFPSLIDRVRQEAQSRRLATPPLRKYPAVDWHGYFRFRTDLFTDVDLGTFAATSQTDYVGTSLFLPPLVRNYANSSGAATFADKLSGNTEKSVGTANLRLRLAPEVRVSDSITVGTTIDLLDNLVLGSTPEYLGNVTAGTGPYSGYPGPAVPLDTFTATQVPPAAGLNSLTDSIAVKEAWGEWLIALEEEVTPDSFNLGRLKLGRFAYDWGLGMVTSRGDFDRFDTARTTLERHRALDSEGGNYLDRAMWSYDLGPVALMTGFAWLASGPTSRTAYDSFSQPYDIEQEDDLWQLDFAFFSRPQTRQDHIARRKALFAGRPVVDWGLYVSYRRQSMSTTVPAGVPDFVADYNQIALVDRDGWLLTPDLWMRLDWRPDPGTRIYIALESAATFGHIANSAGALPAESVDLAAWGSALESNITLGLVSFGLDLGIASGDSADTWKARLGKGTPWGEDGKLTSFAFNRNYNIDLLLYREVLGGISNSAYFRPHFDFDIIPTEEDAFGGTISALYAMAVEPEGWPGDSRHLGLEFDTGLFYEQANTFLATVSFGMLFPFGALDRPADFIFNGLESREADWAWTLQGNMFLTF